MDEQIKKPIQTFREGAVGASIWLRQSLKGPFFELTFSRSYKNERTGASGYSMAFPDRHLIALTRVIERARDWIEQERVAALSINEGAEVASSY
jgi:hypothetical protein